MSGHWPTPHDHITYAGHSTFFCPNCLSCENMCITLIETTSRDLTYYKYSILRRRWLQNYPTPNVLLAFYQYYKTMKIRTPRVCTDEPKRQDINCLRARVLFRFLTPEDRPHRFYRARAAQHDVSARFTVRYVTNCSLLLTCTKEHPRARYAERVFLCAFEREGRIPGKGWVVY